MAKIVSEWENSHTIQTEQNTAPRCWAAHCAHCWMNDAIALRINCLKNCVIIFFEWDFVVAMRVVSALNHFFFSHCAIFFTIFANSHSLRVYSDKCRAIFRLLYVNFHPVIKHENNCSNIYFVACCSGAHIVNAFFSPFGFFVAPSNVIRMQCSAMQMRDEWTATRAASWLVQHRTIAAKQ